jgi:hypothetical protein
MIQIIVILAVAYIISPLLDLILAERIRMFAKIVLYFITLAWLIYTLWFGAIHI